MDVSKEKENKLDTTQTWITDKMDEIELDDDQIEPTKSDQCQKVNESDAIQNKINGKIDKIELNIEQIDKQWEGVNELLLQITTFLIFNTTSLLIAVFAITWTKGGTVFNRTLVLHSQETTGSLFFKKDSLIEKDNPVQILQVTKVEKYLYYLNLFICTIKVIDLGFPQLQVALISQYGIIKAFPIDGSAYSSFPKFPKKKLSCASRVAFCG